MDYRTHHYLLPDDLRPELAKPVGELVEGTVSETIPILKQKLIPHSDLLVAVGDIIARIFVEHGFNPDIIVTDGYTKREKLDEWTDWEQFDTISARCPAAEITQDAWKTLRKAVHRAKSTPIHVKIFGEEDLLVLPLILELPINSIIVYGQPNTGAVIRTVTQDAKKDAKELLSRMEKKV